MSGRDGSTVITGGDVIVAGVQAGVGDVVFAGERIGAVRTERRSAARRLAGRRFDADGLIVAPGFIDAQINGAHGIDVTAEPDRIGELGAELTRYGVTAFVPTVITCSPAVDVRPRLAADRSRVAVGERSRSGSTSKVRCSRRLAVARTRSAGSTLPSPALIDGWTRDAGVVDGDDRAGVAGRAST